MGGSGGGSTDDPADGGCDGARLGATEERVRYASESVAVGDTCVSETQTRTCESSGWSDWSGTSTHPTCQVEAGECAENAEETRQRFLTELVSFGQTCQGETQTRTCTGGSWTPFDGSYEAESCEVEAPNCPTEAEQETRTRYQTASVAYGQTCVSEEQSRTCTGGEWTEWSGDFAFPSCTVGEPAACGGQAHGTVQQRARYLSATIPIGGSCESEQQTRSCQNGTWSSWSGTFENTSCLEGECAIGDRRCVGEQPQACSGDGSFQNEGSLCTASNRVCGAGGECVEPPAPAQLDISYYGGCAVLDDGSVRCFGSSNLSPESSLPAAAVEVAVGSSHACALLGDGRIYCWGTGASGHLGNGGTTTSAAPVQVTGISGATAVATSGSHTCALVPDGKVQCWGLNTHGQLGHGVTGGSSSTPVEVTGITGALGISAGNDHSCAILSDRAVACWGRGVSIGRFDASDVPVAVTGVTGAARLSSSPGQFNAFGAMHACALLTDGSVRCWGDNLYLQAGVTGGSETAKTAGVTQVTSLATGGRHTCAALQDGTVRCFGENNEGQLGNGFQDDSTTSDLVQTVSDLQNVTQVAAGADHSCALRQDRSVWCWGSNRNTPGKLGASSFTDERSTVPVRVTVFD